MSHHRVGGEDAVDKNQMLEPSQPSSVSHAADEEVEEHEDFATPESTVHESSAAGKDTVERPDLSRSVSVQSRPISLRKVPTSARTGLLGRLSLLYEAEDPKGYPRKIKWFITFNIALAAVAAPLGSSIILREPMLIIYCMGLY